MKEVYEGIMSDCCDIITPPNTCIHLREAKGKSYKECCLLCVFRGLYGEHIKVTIEVEKSSKRNVQDNPRQRGT